MQETQETIIGSYNLVPEEIPAEGDVFIRLKPIDLISYWKRCGILANFAAAFYAYTQDEPTIQENSISTVFNELIENATKYSVKRNAEVTIHMMMFDTVLKIQIENLTSEQHFFKFQEHLAMLLESESLEDYYVETLAAKSEGSTDSGIGLLLLLKDYPLKLGAKFIQSDNQFKIVLQAFYYID